jgi:hypothetical protein
LRDRLEDLPLPAAHFIPEFNGEHKKMLRCGPRLPLMLLERIPRRKRSTVAQCRPARGDQMPIIDALCWGPAVRGCCTRPAEGALHDSAWLVKMQGRTRAYRLRALRMREETRKRASGILGMSRRNLYNRLERYSLRETNGHVNEWSYRKGRNGLT